MFNIKMTINGKPMTQTNIKDTIEQAAFNAAVQGMKEKITNTITASEASQIKIDVQGNDIHNLKLNISGPENIVAKINKAMA
jgi:hypothetical protein